MNFIKISKYRELYNNFVNLIPLSKGKIHIMKWITNMVNNPIHNEISK